MSAKTQLTQQIKITEALSEISDSDASNHNTCCCSKHYKSQIYPHTEYIYHFPADCRAGRTHHVHDHDADHGGMICRLVT